MHKTLDLQLKFPESMGLLLIIQNYIKYVPFCVLFFYTKFLRGKFEFLIILFSI